MGSLADNSGCLGECSSDHTSKQLPISQPLERGPQGTVCSTHQSLGSRNTAFFPMEWDRGCLSVLQSRGWGAGRQLCPKRMVGGEVRWGRQGCVPVLTSSAPDSNRRGLLKRELDCAIPCSSVLCSLPCSSSQPHGPLFCSFSEPPLGKWETVHPLGGQTGERILFPHPDTCLQCTTSTTELGSSALHVPSIRLTGF